MSPSQLETRREQSWTPQVRWALLDGGPPPGGTETIDWLLRELAQHESLLVDARRASERESLFRTWLNILAAKSDVEHSREAAIPYFDSEYLGPNRIKLLTASVAESKVIGQPRMIDLGEQKYVSGEIESVDIDGVTFFVNLGQPKDIPAQGDLEFDTRAARRSIQLQRQAVDAVRFRRAVNPDLGDILTDPRSVRAPIEDPRLEFEDRDLDDSKRAAVRKAVGADSVLLVEGPPGTGKTRFITELVLQTLKHEPNARILLTSQTHVALDHALQKLKQARSGLKLVRIGRRDDAKISPEVNDLLLENKVDLWLRDVRSRSENFFKSYALSIGANQEEVLLGMAVGRLRAALDAVFRAKQAKTAAEVDVDKLRREQADRAEIDTDDRYHEVAAALQDSVTASQSLEIELARAEQNLTDARVDIQSLSKLGREIAILPSHEWKDWEDAFLRSNKPAQQLHSVLVLSQEWYLRFGRSRDFFGAVIAGSEVIAGTCLGFAGVRGMQHLKFDLCVVDEASKATVTELMVPLSRSKRWVLVGDRQQLPPFIEDALDDRAVLENYGLTRAALEDTLLNRLAAHLPSACTTQLTEQHRMVHQIGDLISSCFYDGKLRSMRKGQSDALAPALPKPVTWFSTSRLEDPADRRDHSSYKNASEVRVAMSLLRQLSFLAQIRKRHLSVAVLAGYGAQRRELQRAINNDFSKLTSLTIECNTVDAFQGREADIAIYSVTRSNDRGDVGFLGERRRVNVALSRAREGLAVIGDAYFVGSISGYNPLGQVLSYIESHPDDCALQEVKQ